MSKNNPEWHQTQSWADDFVYVVKSMTGPVMALLSLVLGTYLMITDQIPDKHSSFFQQMMLFGLGGGSYATVQANRQLKELQAIQRNYVNHPQIIVENKLPELPPAILSTPSTTPVPSSVIDQEVIINTPATPPRPKTMDNITVHKGNTASIPVPKETV